MSKYVTDELIERGAVEARAWGVKSSHGGWSDEETQRNCARDILEATAPLIAAQALRDAAEELSQQGVEPWDRNSVAIRTLNFLADKIEKDAPTRANRTTEADSWNTL